LKKKDIIFNIVSLVCSLHEITNSEAYRIASSIVDKYGIDKKFDILLKETGREIEKQLIKSANVKKVSKKSKPNNEITKDKVDSEDKSEDLFRVDDKVKGLDDLM
jgi:hypothetical protein